MDIVKKIFSFRMLTMLMMGYCSGLPLLLTGGTLQAWMTDEKIDLTAIGMVSLIGMPYVLKFLWAPFLDRYQIPFLGRRKGWMIIFQVLILVSIFGLSLSNPTTNLMAVLGWAFCIALFSASQDVVVDAYRREIMPDEELGLGSSLYVNGYRLAMIVSGSLALNMADNMPFTNVYKIMALCMIPAILFTLIAPKENHHIKIPSNMKEAVFGPLQEFFTRKGAFIVLLFILLYKVGDSMAANMTTPFILQLGYTKSDLGNVAKLFGLVSTIIGGLIGGVMMLRYNMKWSLIFFGILQAVSTIGFAILPSMPITLSSLAIVVAFENLASGMGTAAYAAYMASLTNKQFTATQYALLTALMGVPRVILSSPTGKMAQVMGWEMFFVFCTVVAIPGLLLLIPVFKLERPKAAA
jgi:PAT family beta-lactamase induction signal transducer AmpG